MRFISFFVDGGSMVWTRFHIWLVPQGPVFPQSGPDNLQIRKKREQKCALYSMFHFLFLYSSSCKTVTSGGSIKVWLRK